MSTVAMRSNRRNVRIEWGDCDPLGIVFFPRYFAIFDDSTAYLFEAVLGLKKLEVHDAFAFAGFPLVEARARFLIPSRCGDDVVVESTIHQFRKASFDVVHRLTKSGELAVEGFETRVWVVRDQSDPDKLKSQPIPREVRDRFAAA
jgi:4-hydroxybenzoyl-CoA thioesterase